MTSRSDFIRILSESILIMNGWLLSAAVLNQWMWILGKQNERLSRRLGARDAVASRPHDSIGPGAAAAAADDAQGRACMHARSLLHLYNPVASTIRCCRPRQPNPHGPDAFTCSAGVHGGSYFILPPSDHTDTPGTGPTPTCTKNTT